MRFEAVHAHEFGPFRGETLEFGPGMNVVYGRNEAGKSSWHAALYAGLCGMRRGKGAMRKEEKAFAARHKPWDSDEWEVGAIVTLEDGRRVELRHDLAGRVESSAEDTTYAGKDYANEILFDGAPDGSQWLGLNRRSFLATACVRQADILKVREDPDALQEDMQRAAATAGTDQTAAAALQRLEEVLRERVGSERAPTKPLMTTAREVAAARAAVEAARKAHRDFQDRRAEVETLERAARKVRLRLEAAKAVLAEEEAEASAERLREARALQEQFPDGPPHPVPEDGGLTREVTEALTMWRNLPAEVELTGPSAHEIEARIAGADRDLAAARAVVAEAAAAQAETRLAGARELLALFPEGGPRTSPDEDARMREIRDALQAWASLPAVEAPTGRSVEELEGELGDFEARRRATALAHQPTRSAKWLPAFVVVALGGAASVLLAPELRLPGVIALVAGAVFIILHRLARPRADRSEVGLALDVHLGGLQRELGTARAERERLEDRLGRRRELVERMRELADADDMAAPDPAAPDPAAPDTVVPDPAALAETLRRREESWRSGKRAAARLGAKWDELHGLLAGASIDELAVRTEKLRARADALLAAADEERLDGMRARDMTAGEAAEFEQRTLEQRRAWSDERARRLAAEAQHARHAEQAAVATEGLWAVANRIGVTARDASDLAPALEEWRARRERTLAEAGERNKSWDRLQQLLGEDTLEEFAEEVEQRRLGATRLIGRIAPAVFAEARAGRPTAETRDDLGREAAAAREEVLRATAQLAARERYLQSVADAEDALEAAEREKKRIARLKGTLDRTIDFLRQAEDRVMRDIAPILTQTVLEWLPGVTDGRYTGCRINPESLLVEVRAPRGRWRRADLLSHGTAEQIYLLLRFALSRHLTREGESCPLILDDVVGASDAERKESVLATLRALARSTQVILFTHEEDVRDWAKGNLPESDGRLIELPGRRRDAGGAGRAATT